MRGGNGMGELCDRWIAAATVCAMGAGFAWFDMPGHASAFAAPGAMLGGGPFDGHAVFLLGMLAVVLLQALAPVWLERRFVPCLMACAAAGPAALGLYCAADGPLAAGAAVALTGFFNVLFLNAVAARILTRAFDRTCQVVVFSSGIALKTLIVYGADRYLAPEAQATVLVALPLAGVACALVAFCRMLQTGVDCGAGRVTLRRPSSTIMFGMLLVASLIFAATRVVSSMGAWGVSYPVTAWGPLPCAAATVVYLAVCYATLARTGPRLLFRFLPALLLLFMSYAFLYSPAGEQPWLPAASHAVLTQYAELYGQAFVWTVILLAVRTLDMPPLRVMGVFFCVFTVFELAMQGFLGTHGEGSLVVVLLSFFVAFAALIAAISHFYDKASDPGGGLSGGDVVGGGAGTGARSGEGRAGGGVPRSPSRGPAGAEGASGLRDARRAVAARHGLSERETEVFLLLVQGRTRRFICDELFIADGTASTHIRRIYEKFGVHARQELLTKVLEETGEGRTSGCP